MITDPPDLYPVIPGLGGTVSGHKEGADPACNLSPNSIATCDKNLLKQLSRCKSFTRDQIAAIRAVLGSGKTSARPPPEWSFSTLLELRILLLRFDSNSSNPKPIPRRVSFSWRRGFQRTSPLPRRQSSRKTRDLECPPEKVVTQKIINNNKMPINYTADQLRICLKGPILAKNFRKLKGYAFTYEQLCAMKENLDAMFTKDGYPPSIVEDLISLQESFETCDSN
ncbi:hypothetical protein lerEdw1_002274 [Lerista edwardsae]|nr:hypothetical protein lerEdw1_002274 [Lerista edwardsae]